KQTHRTSARAFQAGAPEKEPATCARRRRTCTEGVDGNLADLGNGLQQRELLPRHTRAARIETERLVGTIGGFFDTPRRAQGLGHFQRRGSQILPVFVTEKPAEAGHFTCGSRARGKVAILGKSGYLQSATSIALPALS